MKNNKFMGLFTEAAVALVVFDDVEYIYILDTHE